MQFYHAFSDWVGGHDEGMLEDVLHEATPGQPVPVPGVPGAGPTARTHHHQPRPAGEGRPLPYQGHHFCQGK